MQINKHYLLLYKICEWFCQHFMINYPSISVCKNSWLRGVHLFLVLLSVFFWFSIVKLSEGFTLNPGKKWVVVCLFFDIREISTGTFYLGRASYEISCKAKCCNSQESWLNGGHQSLSEIENTWCTAGPNVLRNYFLFPAAGFSLVPLIVHVAKTLANLW